MSLYISLVNLALGSLAHFIFNLDGLMTYMRYGRTPIWHRTPSCVVNSEPPPVTYCYTIRPAGVREEKIFLFSLPISSVLSETITNVMYVTDSLSTECAFRENFRLELGAKLKKRLVPKFEHDRLLHDNDQIKSDNQYSLVYSNMEVAKQKNIG